LHLIQRSSAITGPRGTRADVATLCQASIRLAPSDEGRIYLAVDMGMRGESDRATRLLDGVLAGCPANLIASYAWQNIGMLKAEAEQPVLAFEAYVSASHTTEVRPIPAIGSLHFSVRTESESEILMSARALDEFLSPDHATVIEHCAARPPRSLTSAGERLLTSIRDRLGPTSRRITNVFLKS